MITTPSFRQQLTSTSVAIAYVAQLLLSCAPVSQEPLNSQTTELGPPGHADMLLPTERDSSGRVVGATPFDSSVSLDGAAQVTVPLWTPPGRLGLQPSLALTYSSRGGNGIVGAGWALAGLSGITRCHRTPAQDGRFDPDGEPTAYCLDGSRLMPVGAAADGVFATEVESYQKIVATSPLATEGATSFVVYEPEGTIRRYGSRATGTTANSRSVMVGQSYTCSEVPTKCVYSGVRRRAWMLDRVEDRFGNALEIDYDPADVFRPTQIRYTLGAAASHQSPKKRVDFEYEDRPDGRITRFHGLFHQSKKRLKAVSMRGPLGPSDVGTTQNGVLRRYELAYRDATQSITRQSQLASVTECSGETPAACKPPLTFEYTRDGEQLQFDDVLALAGVGGYEENSSSKGAGFLIADVNSDGLDDIVYQKVQPSSGPWSGALAYRPSNGTTFGAEVPMPMAAVGDRALSEALWFLDLNADQHVDAVHSVWTNGIGNTLRTWTKQADDSFIGPTHQMVVMADSPQLHAVGDLNGDGIPDLLARKSYDGAGPNDPSYLQWEVSFGAGTNGSIRFDPLMPVTNGAPVPVRAGCRSPARIMDTDGNGSSDLLVGIVPPVWYAETRCETAEAADLQVVRLPFGQANTTSPSGVDGRRPSQVFLDAQGDGLPDAVYFDGFSLVVAPNVGGSWADLQFNDAGFGAPSLGVSFTPLDATARTAFQNGATLRVSDFNRDGLDDLFLVDANQLFLSTGRNTFHTPVALLPDTESKGAPWEQLLDFNGDGLVDFVQRRADGVHVFTQRSPPGLLTRVTGGPLAAEVRFTHQPTGAVHTRGTCTSAQMCLSKGMWLVSEIGRWVDGNDATYPAGFDVQRFSYRGGRFDPRGRGWLGFEQRTVTDLHTGAKTTVTFDNTTAITDAQGRHVFPGASRPVSDVTEMENGAYVSGARTSTRLTNRYFYDDAFNGGFATTTVKDVLRTEEEASATGGGTPQFVPVRSTKESFLYSADGFVTQSSKATFAGGFEPGGAIPASAKVHRMRVTRTQNRDQTDQWLLRRYDRVVTSSTEPARPGVPERTRSRTIDYEWFDGTGAVKKVVVEPDGDDDARLVTDIIRPPSSDGTITEVTEEARINGSAVVRRTRFDWDTLDGTFPLVTRREVRGGGSPYSLETRTYFHAGLGLEGTRDDFENRRTQTQFDWFGRPRKLSVPSSSDVTWSYGLDADGLATVKAVKASRFMPPPDGVVSLDSEASTTEYIDRWGRSVRRETNALNGQVTVNKQGYDRFGRLTTQWLPYFKGQSLPAYTSYGYDNRGRVRQLVTPAREIATYEYAGLSTTVTDPRNQVSTSRTDVLGRMVSSVQRVDAMRELTTAYSHGPFDVLDGITDTLGNVTSFQYDTLGRRVEMVDPDTGTTTTRFNAFGETRENTHAGVTTAFEHDGLGRITRTIINPDSNPTEETLEWDTAPWGKGLLAARSSADGVSETYEYDGLSHQVGQVTEIDGTTYATRAEYDSYDNLTTLTYPAVAGQPPLRLSHSYSTQGVLRSVTNADSHELIWSLRDVWPNGVAKTEQFGSGSEAVVTSRVLDKEQRLSFVESKKGGSTAFQQLKYEYGQGGLLKSRYDNIEPHRSTEDFTYDSLGRLETWAVYQGCQKSETKYGYDDLGNLTSRTVQAGAGENVTNSYGTTPNAGPHAISSSTVGTAAPTTYEYDSAGRLWRGVRDVEYTHFDLPRRISTPRGDVTFKYDADHRRAQKKGFVGDTTTYVGGLYEKKAAAGASAHRFTSTPGVGRLRRSSGNRTRA